MFTARNNRKFTTVPIIINIIIIIPTGVQYL